MTAKDSGIDCSGSREYWKCVEESVDGRKCRDCRRETAHALPFKLEICEHYTWIVFEVVLELRGSVEKCCVFKSAKVGFSS